MANVWIFSNKQDGTYGDSEWDIKTILEKNQYYFMESERNRGKVEKGDLVLLREYGTGLWGSCEISDDWVLDETWKEKRRNASGWFPIKNIDDWGLIVPYSLIRSELSNKNHRFRIVTATTEDRAKVDLALKKLLASPNNKIEKEVIYPDINYLHVTELDLQMAELIYPILVDIASTTDNTITYGGVVNAVKEKYPNIPEVKSLHHRHIGRRLGTIWQFTDKQTWPHIGTLVINKDTGECGKGVTEILDPIKEREKVRKFDWTNSGILFKRHLERAKIEKEFKEKRLEKRTYEDAKELFVKFWQEVKDKAPISSNEISKFRQELIERVQEGHAPATAFSEVLLEIFNNKRIKKESSESFLYFGEYRNSETDELLFDKVKIGYTDKGISERAKALSGGVISPLKFVMTYAWRFEPGRAYMAEQALHGLFDEHRQMGEFFLSHNGYLEEAAAERVATVFNEVSTPILIDGNEI